MSEDKYPAFLKLPRLPQGMPGISSIHNALDGGRPSRGLWVRNPNDNYGVPRLPPGKAEELARERKKIQAEIRAEASRG